ncbi:MAG: hypothetical protein Tsb0032_41540 [Kiloniellaceae bacterium]
MAFGPARFRSRPRRELRRRSGLVPVLLAALLAAPPAAAPLSAQQAALPPAPEQTLQEPLVFDVLRDGEKIGEHRIDFERQDDTLKVSVATAMEVSFAFVTLFHYEHKRVERWRGGELQSLAGMTNDDGEEFEVSIVRKAGFYSRTVNGREEEIREPLAVDSLWSRDRLTGGKLFSSESGRAYRVRSDLLGWETIQAGGEAVEAEHVKLSGEVDRDLWYAPTGELVKLRYENDEGQTFEYVRR